MAHYALLDEQNTVVGVIVGRDESDLPEGITSWEDYYGQMHGLRCLRTSYNTYGGVHKGGGDSFRGNYAGPGMTYDEGRDAFLYPQPYPSWSLSETTYLWEAPVPEPTEGGPWVWDESTLAWVLLALEGQ
jgi:hypothetical protein